VRGKVLERAHTATYTYLRLQGAGGEVWAAVPRADVEVGEQVSVVGATLMTDFQGKEFNRKFDRIYFGNLGSAPMAGRAANDGAPAPMAPPAGMPEMAGGPGGPMMGDSGSVSAAEVAARHAAAAAGPSDAGDVKVAKARGSGARTVAEVFAQRASLREKRVAVRGKVVKYAPGIMGLNWMHLRDGTGSAEKANQDLTVTTTDTAAVGDVVTAKGVVRTDKDFGAGYTYPVIVQEAEVAR